MILEAGYAAEAKVVAGALDSQTNPYAESQRIEVLDQYMVGPSLLVAPLFAGEKSARSCCRRASGLTSTLANSLAKARPSPLPLH